MKPTLYLETTVPSYYTAYPSRDIIVLAHQEITREWWETSLDRYDIYVSALVVQEASQGDELAAKRRIEVISNFSVLKMTEESETLAALYLQEILILQGALRDSLHLAIATAHGMDYLLTWNCMHIARGEVKKALEKINARQGIATPTICTPEELLGG